jgi:hypothetical protein
MSLRTCLQRFMTRLNDVSFVRPRRAAVVLWRLRHTSGVSEAACSFTEPTPGIFHVLLTRNGKSEVPRLVHGVGTLVFWAEGVKVGLQANGWREVDVPKVPLRIRRRTLNEGHTIEIGAPDVRRGSPST